MRMRTRSSWPSCFELASVESKPTGCVEEACMRTLRGSNGSRGMAVSPWPIGSRGIAAVPWPVGIAVAGSDVRGAEAAAGPDAVALLGGDAAGITWDEWGEEAGGPSSSSPSSSSCGHGPPLLSRLLLLRLVLRSRNRPSL